MKSIQMIIYLIVAIIISFIAVTTRCISPDEQIHTRSEMTCSSQLNEIERRIIGGWYVNIENYPYQVSVREYSYHICGGVILDEYTILTAAHCTFSLVPRQITIKVGSANRFRGITHKVDKIITHPNYKEYDIEIDYDISILKLKTSITFNKDTLPIQLSSESNEISEGTYAYVSGWGYVNASMPSTVCLKASTVYVISNKNCKEKFKTKLITNRMLCAEANGRDSCDGDSGGPLVADNKLIGVISWGIFCANPNYPGVYTNILYFKDWILNNI